MRLLIEVSGETERPINGEPNYDVMWLRTLGHVDATGVDEGVEWVMRRLRYIDLLEIRNVAVTFEEEAANTALSANSMDLPDGVEEWAIQDSCCLRRPWDRAHVRRMLTAMSNPIVGQLWRDGMRLDQAVEAGELLG